MFAESLAHAFPSGYFEMTAPLCVYNVPLELLAAYQDERVVVRTRDPEALAKCFSSELCSQVIAVQLLDISADVNELAFCRHGLPIEIVLNDPQSDAGRLFRLIPLTINHPVRIVIPVVSGFSRAVKVAAALNLSIKLEGTQARDEVIDELCATLDFYLEHRAVMASIDYYSGLLITMSHNVPVTLWDLQEEDPVSVRFITDDGREALSRRPFPEVENLDSFCTSLRERVLSQDEECSSCPFFSNCGGYFKWPDRDYSCDGIKRVFSRLRSAANELQHDLSDYSTATTQHAG